MWVCPECHRRFGRTRQGHECAPALSVEEYFSTGPPFERPIFELVLKHLQTLDSEVWYEPLSVGIFFKRRTSFLQLRTMTKWVAVCFNLKRRIASDRITRNIIEHNGRQYHVVNVSHRDEVDAELLDWITEAWHVDAYSLGGREW